MGEEQFSKSNEVAHIMAQHDLINPKYGLDWRNINCNLEQILFGYSLMLIFVSIKKIS